MVLFWSTSNTSELPISASVTCSSSAAAACAVAAHTTTRRGCCVLTDLFFICMSPSSPCAKLCALSLLSPLPYLSLLLSPLPYSPCSSIYPALSCYPSFSIALPLLTSRSLASALFAGD